MRVEAPEPSSAVPTTGRSMIEVTAAATAWAVWVVAMAVAVVGAAYGSASLGTERRLLEQTFVSPFAGVVITASYGSVGLLLRLQRPQVVIGWLFLGIGVAAGLSNLSWNYVWLGAASGSGIGPLGALDVAWLANTLFTPLWIALLLWLLLLFPTGHPVDRSWRPAVRLVPLICGALMICLALTPGPILLYPIFANPAALGGAAGRLASIATLLVIVAMLGFGVAALWSMVVRYRKGDESARRQLKWLVWGASFTVVGGIILIVTSAQTFDPGSIAIDASWLVFALASISLPVAALIAIVRDGLYDIDRLIVRTFVFGALTAILAGLYAASIRLFNAMFVGLTGESSEMALVLTTLVLATTLTPLKKRLESVAEHQLGKAAAVTHPIDNGASSLASGGPAISVQELDRRIEAIARRVTLEVVAGSPPDHEATRPTSRSA